MKKTLLLMFLMIITGYISAHAAMVRVSVDNPDNVIITTLAGNGETVALDGEMSQLDLDPATCNPLLIEPAPGAEITSLSFNGNPANPSGDGKYRIGIVDGGNMIQIETSGSGSQTEQTVTIGFIARGDGVTGNPLTVTYEKDGVWETPANGSMGYYIIPVNANVKVQATSVYDIVNGVVEGLGTDLNGTLGEDGSYMFVNTVPDYYRVQMNLKVKESAIRFSILPDVAENVECYLENGRASEDNYELLEVYSGVKTDFVVTADQNPLEFVPAAGATILKVIKNGTEQIPNGAGMWIYSVENGDEFEIQTRGAATDVIVEAPEDNASLDNYIFRDSKGTEYPLTGMHDTLHGFRGDIITVSARPGTTLSYVMPSNGGNSNYLDNFRIVPGADGVNPAVYTIYGERTFTGVLIDVDDASRVSIIQEGGRGEALTLADGSNSFPTEDIKNALAISATDGNQIVSVRQNDNSVTTSPNGYYMIEAAEGDYIEIRSRRSPVDATVTFDFDGNANIEWLAATGNGLDVALSNPMTLKTYETLEFKAAYGYVLSGMTCEASGVTLARNEENGAWSFTIDSPEVTEVTLRVTMQEIQASEGNSIVVPNGSEEDVRFWEMTVKDGPTAETFVRKLENNRVNEVANGHWVRVFCNSTQNEFEYVKVNGEPIELERNEDGLARIAWVQVSERTVIDTRISIPLHAYTNPTYDPDKNIKCGNVFFVIDGENQTEFIAHPGQSVRLTAEPESGYIFDHYEMFTVDDTEGVAIEGDTYTFKESDFNANGDYLLFKGVFTEDPAARPYVLRGSTAWLVNDDGEIVTDESSALGNVVFLLTDGSYSRETLATEGSTVRLEIAVFDEEAFNNYEVGGFALMSNFPHNEVPADYVVSGDDAGEDGVIWICGIIRRKTHGVDNLTLNGGFGYDPATQTVTTTAPVDIYDMNGQLLVRADAGTVSVATLTKGVYVAATGGKSFKFVK